MKVIYVSRKGKMCESYLKALLGIYSISATMYVSGYGELALMKKARSVMNLPFGIKRYKL